MLAEYHARAVRQERIRAAEQARVARRARGRATSRRAVHLTRRPVAAPGSTHPTYVRAS